MPKRLTKEEIINFINKDADYEFVELINYTNSKEKNIMVKHKLCNKEFLVSLEGWKKGNRPHRCEFHKTTNKKTTEEFKEQVKNLTEDYEVIGEYVNKKTKIEFIHKSKQHKFRMNPDDFLSGCRCSICYKKNKKTTEEFKEQVKNLTEDYEVISEYINALTKIKIKHKTCGNEYFVRPNDFLSSESRCPKCKNYKNEKLIRSILIRNNINFEEQKSFEGCSFKNKLKFDFYIPEHNTCIEYDGEFHFQNRFNNQQKFLTQKIRDQIKNNFCEENNIKLIRISFKEKNKIEEIINGLIQNRS